MTKDRFDIALEPTRWLILNHLQRRKLEPLSFAELKEILKLSDGNLFSHMRALESQHLVRITKSFNGRIPCTSYTLTSKGQQTIFDVLDFINKAEDGEDTRI